ncbi:MAG: nuclear transport factor 2 family protein [Gammaproteobacteria bacterium]
MITEEQAQAFAKDWIESWNTHDINRVMSHYDDDVEYFSIFLGKLTNNKTGTLRGKENVKEYLSKALGAYPNLHFKLLNVFVGVASMVLHYQSVNNLIAAEVFELNAQGLASRVQCHYYQA